jgi:hypothetical protein
VGGFMAASTFDIMVILKKYVCLSNKTSSRRGKNENTFDPYVLPTTIMGLENVDLSQEIMFSFRLQPKLGVDNVRGIHDFL